jgi:hypothetical protein
MSTFCLPAITPFDGATAGRAEPGCQGNDCHWNKTERIRGPHSLDNHFSDVFPARLICRPSAVRRTASQSVAAIFRGYCAVWPGARQPARCSRRHSKGGPALHSRHGDGGSHSVTVSQSDFFKLLIMNDLQTLKTRFFGLDAGIRPEKTGVICFLIGRFSSFLHA